MKQTEIGLIPDDWEVKRLGDNVDIFRGGSPRPIEKYLTTNADGINWIKIGDVRPNDKYIHQTEEKIISEGKARSREVKKGDFILSNSMSFGRPYILDIDGCIHDGWLTIQNYAVSFDKEYLYYLLGSDEIFKQYVQMAAGSSVQNLNKEKVSDLQLKVPPLPEQQRISKALSDVDALIFTTEKLLQKKKNIKQGTMQELLTGKKRLPGFAKSTNYKQSELGPIPEDWEVKSLGEICVINPTSSNIIPDEFFYVDLESVSSGKLGKKQKIRRRNAPSRAQRQFEKNDILYQTVRPYQRNNLFVNFDSKNYIASTGYAIIRSNNNVDSHYIYQIIHLNNFVNIILDNCTGTSYPAINPKFLKTIPVINPKKEEQAAIANVLSSMDKEIETLNTKLEKYRNLKNAMMQQLLTGKIRLGQGEINDR